MVPRNNSVILCSQPEKALGPARQDPRGSQDCCGHLRAANMVSIFGVRNQVCKSLVTEVVMNQVSNTALSLLLPRSAYAT